MPHRLVASLFALLCASCTTVKHGSFELHTFAGNITGIKTPEGLEIAAIDNATGAALAKDAISDAASAYVMGKAFDALGNLIEEGADALKDANDTDEAIAKSNNATKAEIETFVPPEPVAPAQ